ncbi:MAG: NusA-like transcription termination signal-binding factor [Candidatus Ranarchaeia archaeon]
MTSNIKLSSDQIQFMNLFEKVTGTSAKDCYIDTKVDRFLFVVNKGRIRTAIGKGGQNILRLRKLLSKDIEVVEYSQEVKTFVRNCLIPAKTNEIKIVEKKNGEKIITVEIKVPKEKGIAIGKNGRNIQKARLLTFRHFGIEKVIII